jgi:two-component system sensor histidine kinase/response regulator
MEKSPGNVISRTLANEPFESDSDRHAHAQDGRIWSGGADQAKTGTLHIHDHDAHLRRPARRCSALRALGIAAYLLKPVRQSELREAIVRVLSAKEQPGTAPMITRPPLWRMATPLSEPAYSAGGRQCGKPKAGIRLLEKRGHHVVVASNGKRGSVAALDKSSYDLVLMDVQMPEMDGLEATCAAPREGEDTGHHQTVVAMTAW